MVVISEALDAVYNWPINCYCTTDVMGDRAGEVQFSIARGRCMHEAEERASWYIGVGVAIGDPVVNFRNNS